MERTDTEPKWLCLIVSSNCSWFADGRCSVQSHTQLSRCQALCVRGERVLFPRSGLTWGHTLMSCWRSPLQVAVVTYSVVTGQGQRVLAGLVGMPLWQKHQLVFEDHLENGEGQGSLLCHAFWASGGSLIIWAASSFQHHFLPSVMFSCSLDVQFRPVFLGFWVVFKLLVLHRSGLNKRSACSDPLWSLCSLTDSQKLLFQIQSELKTMVFVSNAPIKSLKKKKNPSVSEFQRRCTKLCLILSHSHLRHGRIVRNVL